MIYLGSGQMASYSHVLGCFWPLHYNRIGLRLLLYNFVHESSREDHLAVTMRHRNDGYLLASNQDMMLSVGRGTYN